jgi:predicted Zn-dependent peptidase
MGMLRVLSRQGDDRFTWDQTAAVTGDLDAQAAIREAERIFAETRARGATAVRVRPGQAPETIERFDPEAEQIVMLPRVVGG